MSIKVQLSLAEQFLNWYPETRLYIRGRGFHPQHALDKELFDQLCEFFDRTGVTVAMSAQARIARALELIEPMASEFCWENAGPGPVEVPFETLRAIRAALKGDE